MQLSNLSNIGTDPWLGLLMNILIMEFNNLLFPKRYPIEWGMVEALECIKDLPLDGPGGDDFHCSFFSATHIIYALGAHYLCVTVGAYVSIDQNERKRLPMVVSIFTY